MVKVFPFKSLTCLSNTPLFNDYQIFLSLKCYPSIFKIVCHLINILWHKNVVSNHCSNCSTARWFYFSLVNEQATDWVVLTITSFLVVIHLYLPQLGLQKITVVKLYRQVDTISWLDSCSALSYLVADEIITSHCDLWAFLCTTLL